MADSSIRREFLAVNAATLIPARAAPVESHQATGVKAGEITPNPAILWDAPHKIFASPVWRSAERIRDVHGNKVYGQLMEKKA